MQLGFGHYAGRPEFPFKGVWLRIPGSATGQLLHVFERRKVDGVDDGADNGAAGGGAARPDWGAQRPQRRPGGDGEEASTRLLRRDHLAFEVADVPAAHRALEGMGIPCRVVEVGGYCTQLFFEDCDGNMLEIGQYADPCAPELLGGLGDGSGSGAAGSGGRTAASGSVGGARSLARWALRGVASACERAADSLEASA